MGKEGRKKVGLIRKASRSSLITSLVLMLISTIALFFYTQSLLQEEVDEGLYSTTARIERTLRLNGDLIALPPLMEIKKVAVPGKEIIKDTLLFDPFEEDIEPFRELTTYKFVNGENYQITTRSLALESEDILLAIVFSYFVVILSAFVILYYIDRARNKGLWRPFFENLQQMKQFSLASEAPIELMQSDILEFSELNREISVLTDKVRDDYRNLKQFTEDVSHELQTPLALIQAKIENIINENSISEEQYEQLTSIQKDIKRLTQLNKKLTLLTKIDNKQFAILENVNISSLVRESIQNFTELSAAKINYIEGDEIFAEMDPHLAEILCNNLISNAVKHNYSTADIEIQAKANVLSIANKGEESLKQPDKIFTRFFRESNGLKSTGLGLAIAKKICDLYHYHISYAYKGESHIFSVNF